MSIEASKLKRQRDQRLKETEKNIQRLWDNCKRYNIHEIKIPKGDEIEKGTTTTTKRI